MNAREGLDEAADALGEGPAFPLMPRLMADQRLQQLGRVGDDAERRAEDGTDGLAVGIDMDERLLGIGSAREGVVLAGDIAEPGAGGDHQVGAGQRFDMRLGRADAEMAGIKRAAIVEDILVLPAGGDRHRLGAGKVGECRGTLLAAQGAAGDQQGPPGLVEGVRHRRDLAGRRLRPENRVGRRQWPRDLIVEDVLGKHHDHRSGRARGAAREGPHHDLRDLFGIGDLPHRLGDGAEELAIVDFLEGAPAPFVARHLAHQQDHRHRILLGNMEGDRAIGGAGSARHHEAGGTAGHLGLGNGHEAGTELMAAHHGGQRLGVVERIEQRQIAFARHAIEALQLLRFQSLDDDIG